jgi:hypothetical protein
MEKPLHDGIDMLTLYAYSDDAEQEGRASWRGFLSFVVSNLLELDSETTDELIAASILTSPENVDAPHVSPTVRLLHSISAELAAALGMPLEFGFAALLDFRPPTRVTPLGKKQEQLHENDLIALWLQTFEQRQGDTVFQQLLENWKVRLEATLSEELDSEDDVIPADFEDEMSVQSEEDFTLQKRKIIS